MAEQLTKKLRHLRLPDESFHCRGQLRSGERLSRRQQSWFCDGDPAQTRRESYAASYPSAAASNVSNDGSVMLDSTTSSRLSSSVAASSIHVAGSHVRAGWGSTINAKITE